MNVIIADNQEITALAVRTMLASDGVGEGVVASSQAQLVQALLAEPESLVVLDYTLFDIYDTEKLIILCDRFSQAQWLLLSDDLTEEFIRKVMYETKNVSVMFKDTSLDDLRLAFRTTLNGKRYVSQRVAEILISAQQQVETKVQSDLTQTEQDILRMIARGMTTKEIAANRYLSIHTVNTHRKNIFRKLNVNNAHDAVKYAFKAGIVDPSEFYI